VIILTVKLTTTNKLQQPTLLKFSYKSQSTSDENGSVTNPNQPVMRTDQLQMGRKHRYRSRCIQPFKAEARLNNI
jgi:hypothetical protein